MKALSIQWSQDLIRFNLLTYQEDYFKVDECQLITMFHKEQRYDDFNYLASNVIKSIKEIIHLHSDIEAMSVNINGYSLGLVDADSHLIYPFCKNRSSLEVLDEISKSQSCSSKKVNIVFPEDYFAYLLTKSKRFQKTNLLDLNLSLEIDDKTEIGTTEFDTSKMWDFIYPGEIYGYLSLNKRKIPLIANIHRYLSSFVSIPPSPSTSYLILGEEACLIYPSQNQKDEIKLNKDYAVIPHLIGEDFLSKIKAEWNQQQRSITNHQMEDLYHFSPKSPTEFDLTSIDTNTDKPIEEIDKYLINHQLIIPFFQGQYLQMIINSYASYYQAQLSKIHEDKLTLVYVNKTNNLIETNLIQEKKVPLKTLQVNKNITDLILILLGTKKISSFLQGLNLILSIPDHTTY